MRWCCSFESLSDSETRNWQRKYEMLSFCTYYYSIYDGQRIGPVDEPFRVSQKNETENSPHRSKMQGPLKQMDRIAMNIMAIRVVGFSKGVYKIRKIFA